MDKVKTQAFVLDTAKGYSVSGELSIPVIKTEKKDFNQITEDIDSAIMELRNKMVKQLAQARGFKVNWIE